MNIYATVGDKIEFRLNKKGEKEFFTVEGSRVVSQICVGQGEKFREIDTSIRTIWQDAVIRFERG